MSGRGAYDILGNEFKEGQWVLAKLDNGPAMLARVVQLRAPGVIEMPGDATGATVMNGQMTLQFMVPIQFAPGQPITGVWVLKQPEAAAVASVTQ